MRWSPCEAQEGGVYSTASIRNLERHRNRFIKGLLAMLRLAVALLLATAAVASASEVKVPAFLWGSTDFFQPAADGDSRRASYQVRSVPF